MGVITYQYWDSIKPISVKADPGAYKIVKVHSEMNKTTVMWRMEFSYAFC